MRGGKNGQLLFNRYKVSVSPGQKILEMDSDEGYTKL